MAWLGQRLMHAMQWVQLLPQTGKPFFRRILFKGQLLAHFPQDMQAPVARNFLA